MMPFLGSPLLRSKTTAAASASRRLAAWQTAKIHNAQNALPVIPTCPSPTCECAEMPDGLDIDRSTNLNATMAPYAEHVVISSGQADWSSRIEDERNTAPWGELAANIKADLNSKGAYHDPYHNVVVSTSSFEVPKHSQRDKTSHAMLFPSFKMIENIKTQRDDVSHFIRTFLLPEVLHSGHNQLSEAERLQKTRDRSAMSSDAWTGNVHPITSPTILICSHQSRDSRCGILGPLLHAEFTQYINKQHTIRGIQNDLTHSKSEKDVVQTYASHPEYHPDLIDTTSNKHRQPINIGMISHIGGHKFAGNVIIYIPPDFQCRLLQRKRHGANPVDEIDTNENDNSKKNIPHDDSQMDSVSNSTSSLAGTGIWYGRVEPKHVQGIVEQTIGHGKIIKDLFRGGVHRDGSPIRLSLY